MHATVTNHIYFRTNNHPLRIMHVKNFLLKTSNVSWQLHSPNLCVSTRSVKNHAINGVKMIKIYLNRWFIHMNIAGRIIAPTQKSFHFEGSLKPRWSVQPGPAASARGWYLGNKEYDLILRLKNNILSILAHFYTIFRWYWYKLWHEPELWTEQMECWFEFAFILRDLLRELYKKKIDIIWKKAPFRQRYVWRK